MDVNGILDQLREHDRRAAVLATTEAAELDQQRAISKAAELAEGAAARAKQGTLNDLAGTWAVQSDLTLRREWDLNDPKSTYKSALPRNTAPVWATHDFAPISGLQASSR